MFTQFLTYVIITDKKGDGMQDFDRDLQIAQKIVRGSYINISSKKEFIETSGIYRFTNEDITGCFHHLQNKENVLTVIGSGNQTLNSILAGTRIFDCFDISVYPQYYLYLQIASILALSKEDYLKYYFSNDREELFSDYFYDKISSYLKGKYKQFWDTLYMFDEGIDIHDSLLFRHDICNKDIVIKRNPYLQEDNYEKLKHILKTQSININTMVTDIIKTKYLKQYDLINLSNILSYHFTKFKYQEYVEYLKNNLNLSQDGEIINYFYLMDEESEKIYNELLQPNGYVENLGESKLLVYKK